MEPADLGKKVALIKQTYGLKPRRESLAYPHVCTPIVGLYASQLWMHHGNGYVEYVLLIAVTFH